MSGNISDKELEAFDKEEMARHYKEGFCPAPLPLTCYYCQKLRAEQEYFKEYEYFEMKKLDMEDYI